MAVQKKIIVFLPVLLGLGAEPFVYAHGPRLVAIVLTAKPGYPVSVHLSEIICKASLLTGEADILSCNTVIDEIHEYIFVGNRYDLIFKTGLV